MQESALVSDMAIADRLNRIDELLEVAYRSADLGNVDDPLAETVYILLAKQTREEVYRPVFTELRNRYPRWLDLLHARYRDIERTLRKGGLQRQRSRQLKALLRAVQNDNVTRGVGPAGRHGGDLTLSYLQDMADDEAEKFLLQLPGIGPKSARCVMAYALHRERFAVDTHVHRIFTRLGIKKSVGRKRDHDPFEAIVPENMRVRLHVNLIHHGRAVCQSQKPRCVECVLVSFCSQGRRRVVEASAGKPVAVDLFAGAGGMGCGFRQAGYGTAVAVELERNAAQTYRLNHPGVPVLEADATKIDAKKLRGFIPGLKRVDVVLAGPPCQGYSAAGSRKPDDPRNQMFRHVSRLADQLDATVVVLENVPGLRRVNGIGFLNNILGSLRRRKYSAAAYLLNASHFGVPQNRQRFFIFASRNHSGVAIPAPDSTHRVPGTKDSSSLPVTPTVVEVLKGLPNLGPGVEAEWRLLRDGTRLVNGSTIRHSDRVVSKISAIPAGGGPISYRRLELDLARTLVAGHRALPVHPHLNRTMSVREAARIQGFPDTYVFCGPKAEQPLQVANAVPPPVARAIGHHLRPYLGFVPA